MKLTPKILAILDGVEYIYVYPEKHISFETRKLSIIGVSPSTHAYKKETRELAKEIIKTISEHEPWCEFLRTEYRNRLSEPYWDECKRLTTNPDFSNNDDNSGRKELLDFRAPIVNSIPTDTQWFLIKISAEEFKQLFVIKYWTWVVLSESTFQLSRAATNIAQNNFFNLSIPREILPYYNPAEMNGIRKKMKGILSGILSSQFKLSDFKPILIADSINSTPTIIDGCHRASAFYILQFIKHQILFSSVESFLGVSKNMRTCQWLAT